VQGESWAVLRVFLDYAAAREQQEEFKDLNLKANAIFWP